MARPFEFDDAVRVRAEELLRSGMSYRSVGRECGLSLSQVQRVARDMGLTRDVSSGGA